ncbi:integral membrane protein CcmA involved in cell shape determination [Sulfuricella denitrificans skB26]|uniref:Integral membrane protein CcmA involved in cell shape determination n=1 Tax=Sulfuricella denitrificans (strain DSM 22764 / NBRC 105220 / skB26) TaxID=1163617 RepID=S6AAW9_SULDS|nr:polymer-forming cytoskeletal protein [Sulfuricella denitrificans]BAN36320.1 integral membrane protein CcmA involved in cell shape determination [Sulfuricella denitrificans skB26]
MFFGKNKRSRPQNRIDSLIGVGTKIEGNVFFSGGLRVDGTIKGNVGETGDQPSTLVLSEQARIEGVIHVSHVVINGTVVGPVQAQEYVELQSKSRVTGDVFYKTLEMHVGAIVEGKLVHQEGAAMQQVEVQPVTSN